MKSLNNMMWMLGGVGVGVLVSKHGKDIKKFMKKSKKEACKMADQMYDDMMNN